MMRNLDTTEDGVPMMRNQMNKESIELEPWMVSHSWDAKEQTIKFVKNLGVPMIRNQWNKRLCLDRT